MIITGKKFSKPEMSRVINGDTKLASAPEKPETRRLDHVVVELCPDYNRSTLQTFIKEGRVKVDGKVVTKPNYQITEEMKLDFDFPELARPKFITIPALYEDEHVLVINKPIGLLSMSKGEYNPEPTLEDYGLLVHRLDRDTSGVVILAKDTETQTMLRKQFQDRKAHKTYYAVVAGHPKLAEAMIDLPIARNLKHPTTFQVEAGGKPSQTYYRVLAQNEQYSLLELKPTTGRTHQLRVHLKYLGTPILGDRVYGNAAVNVKLPAVKKDFGDTEQTEPRLYLHAGELEITIPGEQGGERKTFKAEIPPEFEEIMKTEVADVS